MSGTVYTVVILSNVALAIILWVGSRLTAGRAFDSTPRVKQGSTISGMFLSVFLLLAIVLGASNVFVASSYALFQPIFLGIPLPFAAALLLERESPAFRDLLQAVPQHWLMGVQFFRIMGGIFLVLYSQGHLPGEFAIPAGYGDVLIGVTAPVVAWLWYSGFRQAKALAIAWNVAGIADFVIAVTLGSLTSPWPLQLLAHDNPNTLVTSFPLVLIPTFAVPVFTFLHVASLKKLQTERLRGLTNA